MLCDVATVLSSKDMHSVPRLPTACMYIVCTRVHLYVLIVYGAIRGSSQLNHCNFNCNYTCLSESNNIYCFSWLMLGEFTTHLYNYGAQLTVGILHLLIGL